MTVNFYGTNKPDTPDSLFPPVVVFTQNRTSIIQRRSPICTIIIN